MASTASSDSLSTSESPLDLAAATVADSADRLRALGLNDARFAGGSVEPVDAKSLELEPKTLELVRLAALVAVGGAVPSYGAQADAAVNAGATAAGRWSRGRPSIASTTTRRRCSVVASGDHEARRHPFHVVLERPWKRLVEVIEVKHEAALGRGERAEVGQVVAGSHVARSRAVGAPDG